MAVLRQLAIEEPERLELRSPSIGNARAGGFRLLSNVTPLCQSGIAR